MHPHLVIQRLPNNSTFSTIDGLCATREHTAERNQRGVHTKAPYSSGIHGWANGTGSKSKSFTKVLPKYTSSRPDNRIPNQSSFFVDKAIVARERFIAPKVARVDWRRPHSRRESEPPWEAQGARLVTAMHETPPNSLTTPVSCSPPPLPKYQPSSAYPPF